MPSGQRLPRWPQFRSIFIQTLQTPNPESLKFVPKGVPVLPSEDGNGFYVTRNDPSIEIGRSPLAKKLFEVDEVKAVYLGSDFVTVTKYAEGKWNLMNVELFEIIMNWAETGKPALLEKPEVTDTTILDDDDEVVAMIKELIETRIRPAVQEDGGDIRYVGFAEDTGIVTVQLAGSCVGCPSSSVTLKQGVENMLMHYIPEVKIVQALEEEKDNSQDRTLTTTTEVQNVEESSDKTQGGSNQSQTKQKSYEERLAQAGIPFSD